MGYTDYDDIQLSVFYRVNNPIIALTDAVQVIGSSKFGRASGHRIFDKFLNTLNYGRQ